MRRAIFAKKNTALQILNMFDLFQPSCHNNVKQGHSPFPNDNFSCMDPVKKNLKSMQLERECKFYSIPAELSCYIQYATITVP